MRRRREKVEITGEAEQIVSFRLGKETFGVKVAQVREIGKVQDITRIPRMPDFIEGVMNLRGQITTVVDLRKRFNIAPEDGQLRSAQSRIIVAEIGGNQLGLIVDAVEDVMRVPKQSITEPPKNLITAVGVNGLNGICTLPTKLIMMLDMDRIMGEDELMKIMQNEREQKAISTG
ncbi:chemotaxis protein CheW [Methanomassiliicoccus luminyensis]|jgi:purine-binding chemotaxis protein CheW|uniref:chemotaxis protein CheW n=1 Tax=Methanomassiliicoccus luminyensis TaxID=1080712 RepID=UPI000674E372|nr:chemotaxis protein CheW [Methanomassiliicoccus luminyensis]